MCLLIVLARTHPEAPLVVAANRDELLDRPAVPMSVLRERDPRVLGGRDELAGGTWLAVNDAGVVAGLTNRPKEGGRDVSKRSRGELPLALASHPSAAAAVEAVTSAHRPSDYNPAWLLVGDRQDLFAVDMTGDDAVVVEQLPPGIHVLENRPLGVPSPKVDHVRTLLAGIEGLSETELVGRLQSVMANHDVPEGALGVDEIAIGEVPPEVKAACVHTERYGTRWSGVVTVPRGREERPNLRYADGPPCQTAYREAASFW